MLRPIWFLHLLCLLYVGICVVHDHDANGAEISANHPLTCFVLGAPNPIPPTDVVTFKGSDAWATVGINRKFGGVAVKLALINPAAPDAPLDILDARSAGGAAWQTAISVADEVNQRIVHYNQAAGNSAANWGFESPYRVGPAIGFAQEDWLPLFSNDYRQGLSFSSPDVLTSPCNHTGFQLGDGKMALVPSLISVGVGRVLRLTDTYMVRSKGDQNWRWIQVDRALYMTLGAARLGNLRIYLAQRGSSVIGPIRAFGEIPLSLKGSVRNVAGNDEDWFVSSQPASYAILAFRVAGQDIGIAIHGRGGQTFTGFLRFRPHALCGQHRDECGSVQWHTSIAMSRFDPSIKTSFKSGDITAYTVEYDIAPLAQLAAEGFSTE